LTVRLVVELEGPLLERLERTALLTGRSKADVVREGPKYLFRALTARDDGHFVGGWTENPEGTVSRTRGFAAGQSRTV
jgi:hypothetical protein